MGLVQDHALGERSTSFVCAQAALGDLTAKPATADAFKLQTLSIEHTQETKPRTDSKQTRSLLERIAGKIKSSWNLEKYLLPSGAPGTKPDDHLLWKAALGDYNNNVGVSDVYSLKNTQQLDILRIDRQMNGILGQASLGSLVEELTLSIAGGEEAKVKFAGIGMLGIHTGTSTIAVQGAAGTTIQVQDADAWNFGIGSLISVGAIDNVMITGEANRPIFTVDIDCDAEDVDAVVKPYLPAETAAGSPLVSLQGSLNTEVGSMAITAFDVTVKNNIKAIEDEAFQQYLSDGIPQDRTVTGNITLRALKSQIIEIGKKRSLVARDVAVVIGSVAGSMLQIDIDYMLIDFAPEEVPEAGEVMIKLPFTARASSAGENEIVFTFK